MNKWFKNKSSTVQSAEQMSLLAVKCRLNNEVHRFSIKTNQIDFSKFTETIKSLYRITSTYSMTMTYKNPQKKGHKILDCTRDYILALQVCVRTTGILRVTILTSYQQYSPTLNLKSKPRPFSMHLNSFSPRDSLEFSSNLYLGINHKQSEEKIRRRSYTLN